ncbi:hypothetical protein [Candidatus Odyssella acanthamoebae]|nr:hypothetical protein [Candidatus Paracaedibacter acanthamoebae]
MRKSEVILRRTILLFLTLSWVVLLTKGIKACLALMIFSGLLGIMAFERPPPEPEYLLVVTVFIFLYVIFWGGIFYALYRLVKLWIRILKQFW